MGALAQPVVTAEHTFKYHDNLGFFRFQLLTLQMITLSLLAVSVASMRIWPTADLSAAHFDKLYSLVLLKWEQRKGASAKSDDVLAMLDEETEALVRAGYRPVFDGEPYAADE